jgi:hypothetical protein
MKPKATRLKIKIRKGKWLRIYLPSLSFRFIKKIYGFGLKHSLKEDQQQSAGPYDLREIKSEIDFFLDRLAEYEPFVLLEVAGESEQLYVRIETL